METLLFITVNPIDSKYLKLENEEKAVVKVWEESNNVDLKIEQRPAVSIGELTSHIHKYRPKYLHISGHSDKENKLYLEDSEGYKKEVPINKLLSLLEEFDFIDCVFLNTCHSISTTLEIAAQIPYIIGMKDRVGNSYALKLSKEFYKALFNGNDIESSYAIALKVMKADTKYGNSIPTIIKNTALIAALSVEAENEKEEENETINNKEEISPTIEEDTELLVDIDDVIFAKNHEIVTKRHFIFFALALILVALVIFIIYFTSKSEDSSTLISGMAPILFTAYPTTEIKKRIDKLHLLSLFERELKKYIEDVDSLSPQKIIELNQEFKELTKIHIL